MANYVLCSALFRLIFPILVAQCVIFRPTGLSAIYLLILMIMPFFPVPTVKSMAGATGIFLKIVLTISVLTALAQFSFQLVLLALPPYGKFLPDCEQLEKIFRHVGIVKMDNMSVIDVFTWISPEIIMLITSVLMFYFCKKLVSGRQDIAMVEGFTRQVSKTGYSQFLVSLGRYLTLIFLCLAAILQPSVQGGFYFMVFLGAATWWASYRDLGKTYAYILRLTLFIVFVHITVLYAYQFQWPREYLSTNSSYVRYFAITPLLSMDCQYPVNFIWNTDIKWDSYLNPWILIILFHVLVLESKVLLNPQLMKGAATKRYGTDSAGSIILDPDDIPLQHLNSTIGDTEEKTTFVDNLVFICVTIINGIVKASYIATNIIMMTWSIMFLSWLTFVLLLWANLLWLIPHQRRSMLRSSPLLVAYAIFLLLSAYIYSMNLTENELPSTVKGLNLRQIGFEKNLDVPSHTLIIKCLFTTMFWITLRQYMKERYDEKQASALAHVQSAPPPSLGDTAETVVTERKKRKFHIFVDFVKKCLMRIWIWFVAATLFGVAITGQRMTSFRILYMALFLFFILTFQLSFRIWRKVMFVFWTTVIIVSMIILVLIYTYQFDNFPYYWAKYLHIPPQYQLDIGLENFQIKQLFMRLVTPTFFVIITIIQLHYFHREFLDTTNLKKMSVTDALSGRSGRLIMEIEEELTNAEKELDLSSDKKTSWFKHFIKKAQHVIDVTFLFFEIHMIKLVFFCAICVCVYDKCASYFPMIILIILGIILRRPFNLIAIYGSSIFVSFIIIMRMIYQIEYLKDGTWNVTCELTRKGVTIVETNNMAEWLGFQKTTVDAPLHYLVRWNIFYLFIATFWSAIAVRQINYRLAKGLPTNKPHFIFPRVQRTDADKDILHCLKFLANYGFYKFGVEICFMTTVALIGIRMDVYSIVYSLWLCLIFSLKRSSLARVWNCFYFFIAIFIPIQYVMVIGLPPYICIDYPWAHSEVLRRIQEWAYLLDPHSPPEPRKLLCDFILLLVVSRQAIVFKIEKHYANQEYPGGSNDSIIHNAEDKNFVNPVPDFITYVRSYLDIIKWFICASFFWITLAIVFLAGTNRVNIFSIGYLIGAFIFLWQGSDLYLHPIPRILKLWNILIGYNLFVILSKSILQIVGCVFKKDIVEYGCWIIQLFGIGCVRKFIPMSEDIARIPESTTEECTVPREFVGLVWDGLSFGFLIMQKRIFQSYNFFHVINETKATTILASRGADLIEDLRIKRMIEQDEHEKKILDKIKTKMEKIKANQQKIQGPNYKDPTGHAVDSIFKGRPTYRKRAPKSYKQAIRSGDYYMFDELDDDELDLLNEDDQSDDDDLEHQRLTAGQDSTKKFTKPIKEEEKDDPQPGTSTADVDDDSSSSSSENPCQNCIDSLKLGCAFINSFMETITAFLNKYSKNYRYVVKVLTKEKKILKEQTDYSVGFRVGSAQVWQPSGSYHSLLKDIHASEKNKMKRSGSPETEEETKEIATSADYSSRNPSPDSHLDVLHEMDQTELSTYDQPSIIRLMLSIWHLIISHSDIMCYFMVFLNQIRSATFLSLPLPCMVLFWGTLTIPRPTKTFWVTLIAYTEVIVLIKCMFQFDIIPWNREQTAVQPYYPPTIIGIERKANYALWDLLMLLMIFVHRFLLKSLGLWKTTFVAPITLEEGEYAIKDGQMRSIGGKEKDMSKLPKVHDAEHPSHGTDQHTPPGDRDPHDRHEDILHEDQIVSVTNVPVEVCDHLPYSLKLGITKYAQSIRAFFAQLLDPSYRVAVDVYSLMFLCDFFNFVVILCGYSSFGTQQDGGVSSYFQDNRVPVLFVVMLLVQFMLIIVDRALFLRKFILGKIVFQFLQIIILHVWLFVLYPLMTERSVNSVILPQMYYMVKCFYLLLSAYQIRCGYPTRILGNVLCKGYGYINMFLFKIFMLIPFLFELRTLMDWMWTDTSMTVFDWIKMEDIFAHIYQLKCVRYIEKEYPQPRGQKKPTLVKYIQGGVFLSGIIILIWFPMVFFSLGNTVGKPNPPYDVTVDIRIGSYEPVYQISAQTNSIYQFNDHDLSIFLNLYRSNKRALTYISNYNAGDIAAVQLSSDSANVWSISPPDKKRMLDEVNSTNPVAVRLQYKVYYKTNNKDDPGVVQEEINRNIPAKINGVINPSRTALLEMLQGSSSAPPVLLEYLLPKFIKVTYANKGSAKPLDHFLKPLPVPEASMYRNVSINLLHSGGTTTNPMYREWWHIEEQCNDILYNETLSEIPYEDCNSLMMYTFNDKIFPATLSIITAGGIIGLYTTFVFVASRILRGIFAETCFKIMFEDMPNVDRVLQLCLDIYLVREAKEFALEEDLFAKLVFLFRSPETLIKWTRPKEELEDDDDPEGGADN